MNLCHDRAVVSPGNDSMRFAVAQSDAAGVSICDGLVDFPQIPSANGHSVCREPQLQGALIKAQFQLQELRVRQRYSLPCRLKPQEQTRGCRVSVQYRLAEAVGVTGFTVATQSTYLGASDQSD